jgi:hypothetical protein
MIRIAYTARSASLDGVISALNQHGFFMAEYSPLTGAIAWHRVVPVNKGESMERQLEMQFRQLPPPTLNRLRLVHV